MRQRAWLRLYCCIIDNGKVRNLAEKDQLMFIWCLVLHAEGRLVGKDIGQIAYAVRRPIADVQKRLENLVGAKLLLEDYTPKGWDEYQAEDCSTERTRRWRERQKENVTGTVGNVTGTVGNVTGTVGNVTGTVGNVTGTGGNSAGNGEMFRDVEERRGEEKRREERESARLPDVSRLLGEIHAIGGEFERVTELQLIPVFQSYPRADWNETVAALRLDYGSGGRLPISSNAQKELRKYAGKSEEKVEKGGDKKQRPPWVDGAQADLDEAGEKAARAAAERQKRMAGGGEA